MWPIPMLLSPVVGVFYPLATLPAWMQVLAHALPPSYVFENLRAVAAGRGVSAIDLAIAGGLAIAYVVAAGWLFARTYRRALASGLIARYSAETVT